MLLFIFNFCPEHNSKSLWPIKVKLHRRIDLTKEECSAKSDNSIFHIFLVYCPLFCYFPYLILFSVEYTLKSIFWDIKMKLHRRIDLTKEECSAKSDNSIFHIFLVYCPLFCYFPYLILFSVEYTLKSIFWDIKMKLHRWIDLIEEKCTSQEW